MNGSPSVKVALFIRNGGSESPCRWFYITGIYKNKLLDCIDNGISFFREIYVKETN